MRAAKRRVNIPYSQDYISTEQVWMVGANGQNYAAVLEIYPNNKCIRNDSHGHTFSDGETMPRHYNSGTIGSNGNLLSSGLHFWY